MNIYLDVTDKISNAYSRELSYNDTGDFTVQEIRDNIREVFRYYRGFIDGLSYNKSLTNTDYYELQQYNNDMFHQSVRSIK